MVTINGQKMAKSLGNFVTMNQLFNGNSPLLERAYSPMTVRYFILQAHYRSTLDFSNEALLGAAKAYKKVINGLRNVKGMKFPGAENVDAKLCEEIDKICDQCFDGLNDDFNTAITIGHIFNLLKKINSFYTNTLPLSSLDEITFIKMQTTYVDIVETILGLQEEKVENVNTFVDGLLDLYRDAKAQKQYDKVDKIRSYFKAEGIVIKDMKNGVDWAYEE